MLHKLLSKLFPVLRPEPVSRKKENAEWGSTITYYERQELIDTWRAPLKDIESVWYAWVEAGKEKNIDDKTESGKTNK